MSTEGIEGNKDRAKQWKKHQQFLLEALKNDPVYPELESLFYFWKNPSGKKMSNDKYRSLKKTIKESPRNNSCCASIAEFLTLFKSVCVGDVNQNLDSNFIAAMKNEFGEDISKSGMKHRLAKVKQMASELKEELDA